MHCWKNLRPPKVIFISSAAVYGFRDDKTRGYSENEELNDATPYAKEKIRLETLLKGICAANGQTLTILRVAGLYGVELQVEKVSFIDRLRKNQLAQFPQELQVAHSGRQIRDFCDFSFLAKLVVYFAENATESEVFNVSTTVPIKLRNLVEKYSQQPYASYFDDGTQNIHNHLDTQKLESFLAQQKYGVELEKELKVLQNEYAEIRHQPF